MRIEVILARGLEQPSVVLDLPAGTTAAEAVARSGLLEGLSIADRAALSISVWSRIVAGDFVLEEGDRVELLGALVADPKDVRRRRAVQRKRTQAGKSSP